MKTIFVKEHEQPRKWFILDAENKVLGRVAARVAAVLRGKEKVSFAENQNMGDYVVVINADKMKVTGGKEQKKLYHKYTGYVGGLKTLSYEELLRKHPEEPLKLAVKGMLPHGRLGRTLLGNVKIYAGSEHPHVGQKPEVLEV